MNRDLNLIHRVAMALLCLAAASTVEAADGVLMDPNTKDYPCWRGPYGNGSAPDCGKPLVASMKDAKRVWTSDEVLPFTWEIPKGAFRASYGSPVVAGGKVFLHYYVPTGYYALEPSKRAEVKIDVPEADDVVLCLDAATGKTLWRTVYEKTAYNQQHGAGKSNGHGMLSVEKDRVFALSAGGGGVHGAWRRQARRRGVGDRP